MTTKQCSLTSLTESDSSNTKEERRAGLRGMICIGGAKRWLATFISMPIIKKLDSVQNGKMSGKKGESLLMSPLDRLNTTQMHDRRTKSYRRQPCGNSATPTRRTLLMELRWILDPLWNTWSMHVNGSKEDLNGKIAEDSDQKISIHQTSPANGICKASSTCLRCAQTTRCLR